MALGSKFIDLISQYYGLANAIAEMMARLHIPPSNQSAAQQKKSRNQIVAWTDGCDSWAGGPGVGLTVWLHEGSASRV